MKKLISLVLVLMMVFALSATALAAGDGVGTVQTDPVTPNQTPAGSDGTGTGDSDDGHTTIGIVSTTAKTKINNDGTIESAQLEFEVPLYVVLAVGKDLVNTAGNTIANTKLGAAGEGSVICPTDTYFIKGTSDTAPIGVKTLTLKSIAAGGWKTQAVTTDTATVTGAKTMALKIGADYMPTTTVGGQAVLYSEALETVQIPATGTAFNQNSLFYKTPGTPTDGPAAIGTTPLNLPIIARVNQLAITDQDVTKAFQIVYTIGLVNVDGGEGGENTFQDAAIFTYLGSDLASSQLG